MIYGYARVSTKGQDKYGNSLPAQEAQLKAAGAEVIYHDSFTGTKMERPAFTELLEVLKTGDTLIVCKLDRFARSATKGAEVLQGLMNRGVTINILNMGVADNTPMGRMMIHMIFAFAEFERDMIVERTQTGKAVAREKEGWKEGRPKAETPEFEKFLEKTKRGEFSVSAACGIMGISRSTWNRRERECQRAAL